MKSEELIKLGKAIEYMKMNYQRPIKLDEISQECGLPPKKLNRIMTQKFGCTFSVLLRKYRLHQAARLLHFDYIPIEIIARRCGFQPNYFFNEFKKEFGKTAKEMKGKMIFPDMPIFKEIQGYPLNLEYKVTENVVLEGYPVKVPKDSELDLLWDVAYGFRHPNGKTDLSCKEKTWGVWCSDDNDGYRLQYLMAHEVDSSQKPDHGKIRLEIPGGKYAVFSVSRGNNWFDTANHAREMAWHAFHCWQILSMKETDKWGFTYECFDEDNAYLYVPLISGFGGIEREKEFGSHTIDKIVRYIDEHILDDKDLDREISGFGHHDMFYREQFQSCYGIELSEYIYRKKLYILADNLQTGKIKRTDIARKYHFDSMKAFEKEFKKKFGVSSSGYLSVNVDLINLDQYYEENMKTIHVEKTEIEPFYAAGKTVKSRADRKSMDVDLPQVTAYWMEKNLENHEGDASEESPKRIGIYQMVSTDDETPIFDFMVGPAIENEEDCPVGMKRIMIEGGKYYVFSCIMDQGRKTSLTDQVRNLIRCIDHVWIYQNWLRTDFTKRVCFYYYDGEKIEYYVPVYG